MVTRADIKRIADLARIELDADEERTLTHDFEKILTFVEQLNEAKTDGVEEASAGHTNVFRQDTAHSPAEETAAALLEAAPHVEHGFVSVKKVIEK